MEIRTCPFCGFPVDEKPYTRHSRGPWIRQGVIKCECGVEMRIHVVTRESAEKYEQVGYPYSPYTAIYDGDVNDVDAVIKFTKDELAKRWNSRSDDA